MIEPAVQCGLNEKVLSVWSRVSPADPQLCLGPGQGTARARSCFLPLSGSVSLKPLTAGASHRESDKARPQAEGNQGQGGMGTRGRLLNGKLADLSRHI